MGNTATTPLDSAPTQQEVISALEAPETVPDEVLESLMWDSPPDALLAAIKEGEDFGLDDFVWLDRKEQAQPKDEQQETDQDQGPEAGRVNLDEETRAKRLAEIRRRVEEEIARRKLEAEKAEKERAKNALVPQCEHCKAPITKGLIAAASGNGKFYCKAHGPHTKKTRNQVSDKATQPKRQRNNRAKGH